MLALFAYFGLFAFGAASAGSSSVQFDFLTDVPYRPQETALWCWAAAGQMVMDYFGEDHPQCRQMQEWFCENPNSPECSLRCCRHRHKCAWAGAPRLGFYHFDACLTNDYTALRWPKLQDQIHVKRKPFIFEWIFSGNEHEAIDRRPVRSPLNKVYSSGHFMVVVGYAAIGEAKFVFVYDPLGEHFALSYDAFVSGPHYQHMNDYFDISKKK